MIPISNVFILYLPFLLKREALGLEVAQELEEFLSSQQWAGWLLCSARQSPNDLPLPSSAHRCCGICASRAIGMHCTSWRRMVRHWVLVQCTDLPLCARLGGLALWIVNNPYKSWEGRTDLCVRYQNMEFPFNKSNLALQEAEVEWTHFHWNAEGL